MLLKDPSASSRAAPLGRLLPLDSLFEELELCPMS